MKPFCHTYTVTESADYLSDSNNDGELCNHDLTVISFDQNDLSDRS